MIYSEPNQEKMLKKLSAEEHTSETEIMRRALDLYVRERFQDPLLDLIGAFEGPLDGAAHHDNYIYSEKHRG